MKSSSDVKCSRVAPFPSAGRATQTLGSPSWQPAFRVQSSCMCPTLDGRDLGLQQRSLHAELGMLGEEGSWEGCACRASVGGLTCW